MSAFQTSAFNFRGLHSHILLGTASDRYSGWIGQIYTRERYIDRIIKRQKKLKGRSFQEQTLPVDSVQEYFAHFPILEIDYTFYSPLLDKQGRPAKNFHVLKSYAQNMGPEGRVILKVPQAITAQKLRRGSSFIANYTYLDTEIFEKQFYTPALEILGDSLYGLIFEQEYQRKQERISPEHLAADFDRFFSKIPADNRYHIELRTEAYLTDSVFEVMARHGAGQVLSHWTWLPPLEKQLAKAGGRMLNSGKKRIIRLMTPRGMRYEDAYAKAYPFDRIIKDMLQPEMIDQTVNLVKQATASGIETSVIINNRSGGNAPLIAQRIADRFQSQ